jgi:hypothetical protein
VNFVSAFCITTIDELGFLTAFGLRYYDAEVIAAPRTRSGKVDSHLINLALSVVALNTGPMGA